MRSIKTPRCKRAKCKHLCRCQPENVIIQTSVGTGAVPWCVSRVLVPDPGQEGCPAAPAMVAHQGGASPGIPECLPQPCQPESQEHVPGMAGSLPARPAGAGHSLGGSIAWLTGAQLARRAVAARAQQALLPALLCQPLPWAGI